MNITRLGWLVAGLTLAPMAAVACDTYDVTVTQVSGGSYNPTDPLDTRITLELRATGTGLDGACADLAVVLGPSADDPRPLRFVNGSSDLQGRFPGTSNAVQVLNRLRLTAAARSQLVAGQPVRIELSDIQRSQFVRAGDYTSEIQLRVGNSADVFTVATTVLATAVLLGASADGQEQIALGDISNGASGSTRLFYRSNSDLRISATSDNAGHLVHASGAAFGRIPYDASFSGAPMNLAAGAFSTDLGFSGTGIRSETLAVEVDAPGEAFAGLYRDIITLSFQPY